MLLIINVNFTYVIFFTKTYSQKNTLGTINSQWSININKLSVQGGTDVYKEVQKCTGKRQKGIMYHASVFEIYPLEVQISGPS